MKDESGVFQFAFSNANARAFTVLVTSDVESPADSWEVLGTPVPVGNTNTDGDGKRSMSVMPDTTHNYSLCVSNFAEFILAYHEIFLSFREQRGI